MEIRGRASKGKRERGMEGEERRGEISVNPCCNQPDGWQSLDKPVPGLPYLVLSRGIGARTRRSS